MCAARIGLSVVLIERGTHPRFTIGESSTPLSNLLLEELCRRYELTAVKPLTKWGSWQEAYPSLACGLKRGFSFFSHQLDAPKSSQNVPRFHVEASPNEHFADTNWFRSDFDAFLVEQAQQCDVEFYDHAEIQEVLPGEQSVELLGCIRDQPFRLKAGFLVDATGPRGLLHRLLHLSEENFPHYPKTEALFSHFSGVRRLDQVLLPGETRVTPYAQDDAAVHHLFDGGWIWVLRFNNGITSAGVAFRKDRSEPLRLAEGERAWKDLIQTIPMLEEQFATAALERPFTYVPQLSFLTRQVHGLRWALLPSAAGNIDPLLSTGIPLTLLGVERLAVLLERHWEMPSFGSQLRIYARATVEELLATSRLVTSMYDHMAGGYAFESLSRLYFAAVSYSEASRRLGRPDTSKPFLLHNTPGFGWEVRRLWDRLQNKECSYSDGTLSREVERIIAPIDVAGLSKMRDDHIYPFCAQDLLENAWKLGSSRAQVGEMLERTGLST